MYDETISPLAAEIKVTSPASQEKSMIGLNQY